MIILPILFTFLSVSPIGYTYRDRMSFNIHTNGNASYNTSANTTYYTDNYITYQGYLNYNDMNSYNIESDNVTFNSDIYTDDGNQWEYVSTLQLTIPLNNVDDLEWYFNRLRFRSYFDNDYFIVIAELHDINDDYWNAIDSVGQHLAYTMQNQNEIETRFNIEYMGNQILDRINGKNTYNYDEYREGYDDGYIDGFNEGFNADSTAVTIFNGILNIALVPINVFLAMFNFEILGINISGAISAILSVCVVIIVIRFITGKKESEDD